MKRLSEHMESFACAFVGVRDELHDQDQSEFLSRYLDYICAQARGLEGSIEAIEQGLTIDFAQQFPDER